MNVKKVAERFSVAQRDRVVRRHYIQKIAKAPEGSLSYQSKE
jgi:hypothetical protein